jgi:pentatricopeptide repeat protein
MFIKQQTMNKRKLAYGIFFGVTAALFVMIFAFAKDPQQAAATEPAPHRGTYAMSAEWLNTEKAIEGLKADLELHPEDTKVMVQLAQAYVQEGRNTGDHAYYDKATLELTNKVLAVEPGNFEALCCEGTVLLSQHHFSEALETAKKAHDVNPASAFVYGMMVDAYVELGNYEEAVKTCDLMISTRPDIRSYARVSYLREIYGDIPGAIAAMKMAVGAGYSGLEQTEWCRVQLGKLYEQTGAADSAKYCYELALYNRTDYAFALAGMARIEKANGNYAGAIAYLNKANAQMNEYSFYEELADVYHANGNAAQADSAMQTAIELLGPGVVNENIIGHGHYADRELALAYAKTGNYAKAIGHAVTEYKRRPGNIDIQETLAWVYYKAGYFYLADRHMSKAMRTGKKNPETVLRAGLIKMKSGQERAGRSYIAEAQAMKGFLDQSLQAEASVYLTAK